MNPRTYERSSAAQAIRQSTDNFEQPAPPPPPSQTSQQLRTSFSEAPVAPNSGNIRINDIEKEALRIKHDDLKNKYEDLKNQFDRSPFIFPTHPSLLRHLTSTHPSLLRLQTIFLPASARYLSSCHSLTISTDLSPSLALSLALSVSL